MWLQSLMRSIKRRIRSNAWAIGLAAGAFFWVGWMSMIGNPHVAETFFGVGLGIIFGFAVFWWLRKWTMPSQNSESTRR